MIVALFLNWGMFYVMNTLYSYKFMYQTLVNKPLRFHEVRRVLSILEIVALFTLSALLIVKEDIIATVTPISLAILTRIAVTKITYIRAIREMAKLQQTENNMSTQEATEIAKTLIDIQIKDGRR